ncbi:efflux RND transporter periplasmic adaptor subunit [Nitrincola sp. A-D6]|uniref:efflux RND transporter periplasmic adaptor subunit n=1 Tax=Nitrincola sp. A-D6 TaxID=1545442 RepID=UPI001184CE29|nr:efflux RND transporter periplasmic adaptor subunit [Nitrincola sp. A-D6]
MHRPLFFMAIVLLILGCSPDNGTSNAPQSAAPWVRTLVVTDASSAFIKLSGTVKGRYETPVAFQVSGRILERHVDAGQRVEAGQLLFQLDPRDLLASVRVAEAEMRTTEAALAIARSELQRQQKLVEGQFVSRQTLERYELTLREAISQHQAANAVLEQTRNALDYAELRAEKAGILNAVTAEPGQVVTMGQPLATLIDDSSLEVEVYLAEGVDAPASGSVLIEGEPLVIVLREVAASADPDSRSWRARYRIESASGDLSLGTVVQVMLDQPLQDTTFSVPLGALDERNQGPQVWQVIDEQVQPVPVEVLELNREYAGFVRLWQTVAVLLLWAHIY